MLTQEFCTDDDSVMNDSFCCKVIMSNSSYVDHLFRTDVNYERNCEMFQ